MRQYAIYFQNMPVEYTGYFKSIGAVRKYLKQRYSDLTEVTFKVVYPQEKMDGKVYSV